LNKMNTEQAEVVEKQTKKTSQNRMKILDDLQFQRMNDGTAIGTFKQKVSKDFRDFKLYNEKYKQHVIEKRRVHIRQEVASKALEGQHTQQYML